jgi:uncharacterized protein YjbI with pentapeptide repeats
MANEEQLELIKQGVDAWNKWRVKHPDMRPDLSGTDLPRAILSGVDLTRANLRAAGYDCWQIA